jgi:hypothetical protein
MYSFSPLADIPVDHAGLFIVGMGCAMWLAICLFNSPEDFFVNFFFVVIIMAIGYGVSFHWTNQEPKTFKNEKVTAELVGFQPEGYREKSGKSMVDRHYMYVVYRVGSEQVILQAQTGVVYPQTAILYKN